MKEKKIAEISRKDFLKGSGASLAGLVLLGGIGGLVSGCASEELESQATNGEAVTASSWGPTSMSRWMPTRVVRGRMRHMQKVVEASPG